MDSRDPKQSNFFRKVGEYPPDFRDMIITLAAVLVFVLVWVALP
jgi:hypothetical protein